MSLESYYSYMKEMSFDYENSLVRRIFGINMALTEKESSSYLGKWPTELFVQTMQHMH